MAAIRALSSPLFPRKLGACALLARSQITEPPLPPPTSHAGPKPKTMRATGGGRRCHEPRWGPLRMQSTEGKAQETALHPALRTTPTRAAHCAATATKTNIQTPIRDAAFPPHC
eukprot:scaffold127622_cov30-Tisochrysis_lutea.AAC.1